LIFERSASARRTLAALVLLPLATLLTSCAGSPITHHFTLGTGLATALPQGLTPSVVITQTTLPTLIDRPQLVIRRSDNRVSIEEFQRWAAPLQREIPRVLADELGRQLDSGRVLSLPVDGQDFDADFRLRLDIQRFEALEGQGAEADVVWRLRPRQGKPVVGRSVLREASEAHDAEALVAAQRRLLNALAADIAGQVRHMADKKP
jgi:hypothetical protein